MDADRVNGYHDLQLIPWTWNGVNRTPEPIHFTENANGQPVQDIRFSGDGKDAFRMGHNEVWTPYSNPNSQRLNKASTPFGLKLNSLINGVFSINIYVNTSLNAPPSKPQDFNVTVYNTGDNAHPKLNWELNIEPDVINSSQAYLIERSINGGAFSQIATVNGSTSQYIDYGVSYAGGGPHSASYKIRAKDTQSLTSLYTEIKTVRWGAAWKNSAEKEAVITEYKLEQNYPNPFNPSTIIHFELPEPSYVSLSVYDILGKEVAKLVDKELTEGYYDIQWNASNYPSGIYIYRISTSKYSEIKKMLLVK